MCRAAATSGRETFARASATVVPSSVTWTWIDSSVSGSAAQPVTVIVVRAPGRFADSKAPNGAKSSLMVLQASVCSGTGPDDTLVPDTHTRCEPAVGRVTVVAYPWSEPVPTRLAGTTGVPSSAGSDRTWLPSTQT